MARKISMIDLAGIGNLLEYLVAADNITCEERDRIILRIAKENDIAEYTLSALAGYGKSKSEVLVGNINNPYTYLAQIKSTFSYYPGASKLFGGQPQIAKYNYTLYRGFEEFIND